MGPNSRKILEKKAKNERLGKSNSSFRSRRDSSLADELQVKQATSSKKTEMILAQKF
jgi:hypothetical protein